MWGLWLVFQISIALIMLSIGAISDLRTRSVPNLVWLVFGVIGGLVAAFQYGFSVLLGIHFLFAGIVSAGIYVAWRLYSSNIGGADVKAIMALGVIISPLAFLTLAYAVVLGGAVLLASCVVRKISLKEITGFKVPFIPFLLFGLVAVAFTVFV